MKLTYLIKSHSLKLVGRRPAAPVGNPTKLAALGWVCLSCLLPLTSRAHAQQFSPGPDLTLADCGKLEAPAGHFVSAHFYASGVQIYRWDGSTWVFIAPDATLSADPCNQGEIAIHYAGPTWEAADGGKVVAARLEFCSPARGAIPWLLLGVTSAPTTGRFAGVTHIQRVNTVGGTAPGEAGAFIGDEARVPYTAEYYFYKAVTGVGSNLLISE